MLQKYSYKQKNIFLGFGIFAFSILAYYAAFSETINLVKKYQENQNKLIHLKNAGAKIKSLEKRIQSLNLVIGGQIENTGFQQVLLENTSSFCSNHLLKIDEFPKPSHGEVDSYHVETYQFTMEGPFHESLEYLHLLENKWKIGKAASISMVAKLDHRTKKSKLYSTIFLQSIKLK